jgi:hypothetical protein
METETKKAIIEFQSEAVFSEETNTEPLKSELFVSADNVQAVITNSPEVKALFADFSKTEMAKGYNGLTEILEKEPTYRINRVNLIPILKLLTKQKDAQWVDIVCEKNKPIVFKLKNNGVTTNFIIAPVIINEVE